MIGDIEGGEIELLDPIRCPKLLEADMLIECHKTMNLSVIQMAELLIERFTSSHVIKVVDPRMSGVQELKNLLPELAEWRDADVSALADEDRRYAQKWLFMRQKEPR